MFAIAGRMKRFNEWSPWADLDPATKYTFEGPETGTGQKMMWVSAHPDVGNGSQTIVEFEENRRIVSELDFGGMGKARASLELAPVAGGTAVTWGFKTALHSTHERWLGTHVRSLDRRRLRKRAGQVEGAGRERRLIPQRRERSENIARVDQEGRVAIAAPRQPPQRRAFGR